MKSSYKKRLFLLLVFLGFLGLGICKSHFLGHFGETTKGALAESNEHYPLSFGGFVANSFSRQRWIINIIISVLYAALTTFSVHVAFRNEKITQLVLVTYAGMMLMVILLAMIDVMIGQRLFGYNSARAIKDHLIQTPFVMILFVGAVRVFKGKKLFDYPDSKNLRS